MNLISKLFLVFLIIANSTFSQVKDSITSQKLDEVIITATRTERQLSSLPLPVQLISKAQIKQTGALKLNDILEEQTGLIVVPTFGGVLGIQMQGLDAQYTLILVDGVPLVGRSAGTLDLSRVTVNNIKQIEIVKGASSSLYGSEALGGVINIITETPKETKLKGEFNSRLGTFFTTDNNLNFGFGIKKLNINASINSYSTDSYDLDQSTPVVTVSPFKNLTTQLQLKYSLSNKLNFLISNRYFNQSNNVDFNFENRKVLGAQNANDYNSHSRIFYNPNQNLNFIGEFYASQYFVKEAVRFQDNNNLFYDDFFKENLIRPEIRTSFKKRNTTYTFGIGYNFNNLERTYFSEKALNNSYYSFLQYDYNIDKKWNVLAGIRFDKNLAYASVASPKLALNFNLNKQFSLQSSIGYGFKAPDLRQLYFDFENVAAGGYIVLGYNVALEKIRRLQLQDRIESFRIPIDFFNTPMKPENSVGYNFSIKHDNKTVKTSINAFYNEITNQIETLAIARLKNNQNIFSYKNVASIYTAGLEFNSSIKITNNIDISSGYQYLIAKDNDVINAMKKEPKYARDANSVSFELKQSDYFGLFNRSKHTANFKYFMKIPAWNLNHNFRATYRSKYGLFDTNNNAILDNYDVFANEYVIFDTSLTKKIKEKFEIQLGVDNILNFTDPQNATNFAGRLTYCKVQYNF